MKRFHSKIGSRRRFLLAAAAAAAVAAAPGPLLATSPDSFPLFFDNESLEKHLAEDPMRPQFHLLPAKNWMNDPNGPIYFNGRYHMFFQYNPLAAVWGDMSWNHAVSKDMLYWTHLPLALTPTPDGPDAYGCFSGSAIAVGERVYMVYTGTVKSTPAEATIHADDVRESQCLAWSDDPMLLHWRKDPNPIIPAPPRGLDVTGFRDPSAWRQGDMYYMTVGSGIAELGGCVLLYRSNNLRQWEYLHKLTSGSWNGRKTSNPCDDGEMWECPDFFAVNGVHVLIYSTLGKVFWQTGTLDQTAMVFHPAKTGELDLGAFYAPKTQTDAEGRRILWGWIQERRSDAQMRAAGWSGMMSLPRVLTVGPDGALRMQMLPQLSILRHGIVAVETSSNTASTTLSEASGEVLCSGLSSNNLTFIMTSPETELLRVTYSASKHAFHIDGSEILLAPEDAPTLHAFVDASVIELIVGGRIGYTKRFYFTEPSAPDIVVHAEGMGLTLDAWKIAPISNNRMTTMA